MKIEDIKLGMPVYALSNLEWYSYSKPTLIKFEVFGVDKTGLVTLNTEARNNERKIYLNSMVKNKNIHSKAFTFSEKKAKNMFRHFTDVWEHRKEKIKVEIQKEKENLEYNKLLIKRKQGYIGKEVKVKFGRDENGNPLWVKTKIDELHPTYKKGELYFKYRSNVYLLKKEEKTWYFWTQKRDLEEQIKNKQEEIERIKKTINVLKGKVNEIK